MSVTKIMNSNNRYGQSPFQQQGVKVNNPASTSEAIIEAGLDWNVETVDISIEGRNLEGYKALVRADDHSRVFSVVKNRYMPIQNVVAFNQLDSLIGQKGVATIETAGQIDNGRIIWLLAKLPESISVKGEEVKEYFTIATSHDKSISFQEFFTPIRIVCQNTLMQAISKALNTFYCRHTTNYEARLAEASEFFGIANKFYSEFGVTANSLANSPMTSLELDKFVDEMFKSSKSKKGLFDDVVFPPETEVYVMAERERKEKTLVKSLFETGRGMDNPEIRGTKWAGYNALVEYVDYYRTPKQTKNSNTNDARLNSSWFGSGATLKDKAWSYLTATN